MSFDETQLNATAAHLLRAKRYIEKYGWRQGDYGMAGGPRCVVGAIRSACSVEDDGAIWAERLALIRATGTHQVGLFGWNDSPSRTVEEVYAAFDRAIALAMEVGE